eukprot:scaffold141226_cov386-Phaeocystis_antarctica.AAC.2
MGNAVPLQVVRTRRVGHPVPCCVVPRCRAEIVSCVLGIRVAAACMGSIDNEPDTRYECGLLGAANVIELRPLLLVLCSKVLLQVLRLERCFPAILKKHALAR